MKVHRAVTLGVLILLGLLMLLLLVVYGVATFNATSLAALVVVLVASAVAGVAFSFRRYFPRRR